MERRNWNPNGHNNQIRQRKVWGYNFAYEMSRLDQCLRTHSLVAIDTEFTGLITPPSLNSIDGPLYQNFQFNINRTKMIQLGLTALNQAGTIGGSWEFNFSDFDRRTDAHNPSAISFLMANGIDFERLRREGIPLRVFARRFLYVVRKNAVHRWITFHGLYDIGYLMKAMGVVERLPKLMSGFETLVANEVGMVRDLKHMARFCYGLEQGNLGLRKLAKLFGQDRFGLQHRAGSNSLLTALIHLKMAQCFNLDPQICDGFLYGFSYKVVDYMDINPRLRFANPNPFPMPFYYNPYKFYCY